MTEFIIYYRVNGKKYAKKKLSYNFMTLMEHLRHNADSINIISVVGVK